MFRRIKGRLTILLCASMLAEVLYPAAGLSTVNAAVDTGDILSDPQVYEDADILDDASGEEDISYDGYDDTVYVEDPDYVSPGSQDAGNYFTEEEIEAAEAFYDSLIPEEKEPSKEEIEAELREKERIKAETSSQMLDDTYKLDDNYEAAPENAGTLEQPEGGWFSSSEEKVKGKIDGKIETMTINELMKTAASKQKPIYLVEDIKVVKTAVIPEGKSVTIYLCEHSFIGQDALGRNPIFKMQTGSTLKIYGNGGVNDCIKIGGDGAIIAGEKTNLRLESLHITNNKTSGNGGGLYLGEKVKCELYNVKIHNNSADKGGGGLCVAGTLTNVSMDADTEFADNEASYGGAIYILKPKVNLYVYGPAVGKTIIKSNKAKDGGGIYFYAKEIRGSGFKIINNRATSGYGGGVRMETTGASLANCEITGNSATKDGGGVYVNGKVGTLTDVIVQKNSCGSTYHGGGIYVDSMDNLSSGGLFNVTENYKQDSYRSPSDLCLQDGLVTEAYLHAASYSPGSKIGIYVTKPKEGRKITFEPGNFNPKLFYSNYGGWYIASDSSRNLRITKNKTEALYAEVEKLSGRNSNKNSSKKSSYKYGAANGINYDVYEGYASSPSHTDEKKEIVNKYFYSDGYFFDDPKTYNPHLATFGMNLAMASADTNTGGHTDYSYKFDNVKSLMRGIGCKDEDIWISPSYIVKPTDSSIGVAIGSKTITGRDENDKYTLVPIAVRSYNYEKEWASNMTIDAENTKDEVNAESSGFRDARTKVMDAIRSYISNYGLDAQLGQGRVKFFIVGFSRGSATANLTSKALVDEYGELSENFKDKPNQVFGYCFAVPSGGTDSCDTSLKNNKTAYYCIHNIINKVDLTPMVAPKEMGFKRYGVDHYVPGNDAGTVKTTTESATADNGSYKITKFYDNDAWYTDSSAYRVKRPSMLKQLMLINDEIHFVDYFKETDIDIGIGNAIGSAIRGLFTESSPIERNEVRHSKVIIENWLPSFYKTVQTYNTVGKNEKLTRKSYSSTVIRAGQKDVKGNGKKNWYSKGKTGQDTFRGLVQMLLSKTPTEKANLGAAFSGISNKLGTSDLAKVYFKLINSSTGWDESGERQQDYLDMFWNHLRDDRYGQKAIQDAITDPAEMADLENYYPSLMSIIFRFVRQDFNDSGHKGHMRLAGTFAANSEAILQGHVPEIALAWLRSYDSYYANETKAYVWKEETVVPGTVSFSINGAAVTSGPYTNDQVVKLRSTSDTDAIYYTLSSGNGTGEPVILLYNDRIGIPLAEGDSVSGTTYQIKAWTKCSGAKSDGTIGWRDGTAVTQSITVKSEPLTYIKLHVNKHTYNGSSWTVPSETVNTNVGFKKGQRCVLDLSEQLDMNGWSCAAWHYVPYSGSGSNIVDLIGGNADTVDVELYPLIKKVKIDADEISYLKPEPGAKCIKEISANKIYAGFSVSQEAPLCSGSKEYPIAWEQKKNGQYIPVITPVFAGATQYRAKITIEEGDNEQELKFDDGVKAEGEKVSGSFDKKQRELVICIEYEATPSSKIAECKADVQNIEIWREDGTEEGYTVMRENIRRSLPVKSGAISAEGKNVSGLEVEWDIANITNEKLQQSRFNVYGTIKHGEGSPAYRYTGYDWNDRNAATGLGDFQVAATVNIIEKTTLMPPVVDVVSGNYVYGYDEFHMDNAGNMVISLTDPNTGVTDTVKYKKWIDGGTEPSYSDYVEGTPITFDKPALNTSVTYRLKVQCTTTETGFVSSSEQEYTYTLRNPIMHSVYAYTHDINTPAPDKDHITENAKLIGSAEKGDYVLVDYDSLLEYESLSDDEYESLSDAVYEDLVSWNKITFVGDTVTVDPMSERSDAIWQKVEDDVYLEALTAPFIDEVNIELDKPKTGEGLPEYPEEIDILIGEEFYSIDPESVSVTWSASENSIKAPVVRSKTTYTADVLLSANMIEAVYEDGSIEKLGLRYFADEFTDVEVNGEDMYDTDSTDDIADIDISVEEDVDALAAGIHIYITYTMTDKAKFLSVEPPEGLSLSFDEATKDSRFASEVSPKLPGETAVFVNDGSIQTLSVNWVKDIEQTIRDEDGEVIYHVENGVAYETFGYAVSANELNGLDDHSVYMNGYVVLPDDMDYEKDENGNPVNEDIEIALGQVRCYFDYPVYLGGAPETDMPEILPISGDYEPSTQEVVVDFNTFPKTSSENSVDVYYKINYYEDEEEPGSEEDEDIYDYDPPCWYGENGSIEIAEGAYKYVPFDAKSGSGAEDLEHRTITREKLKAHNNANTVKVSAIAVENGDFRMSSMSEEYYMFLDKPTADIPEETIEALNNLSIESGMKLESITLPENCKWYSSTDIYKVQDGTEGDYVDAVIIYNNDPDNYSDLILGISIELKAGTYTIMTEDCKAYLIDEAREPEEWTQTGTAKAGNEIYVRADSKQDMEIVNWIVVDDTGTEVVYECGRDTEGNYDLSAITFVMPRGNVLVKPVMTDKDKVTATVNSLTVDKTNVDLKKNDSAEINASVIYGDTPEDAIKPVITFKSSDPSVVSVAYNGGKATIKALGSGQATVWAYCADKTAACVVTVGEVYVNLQLINARAYDVNGNPITDNTAVKGQPITLKANEPKNASEVFVKWNIASGAVLNKGDETKSSIKITLLTDLEAEALYDTAEEYKDKGEYTQRSIKVKKFSVTQTDPVSKKEKKVTKLYVNKDQSATVNAAAEYDPKQTVKPEIVFRSNNTDVVVVKTVKTGEGKAQAVIVGCRTGNAVITAYCGNKTSRITVTVGDEEVTGVTLFSERMATNKTDDGQYVLELNSGEQELIDLTLEPYNNVAEKKVKWKSDDTKVATVKDGLVTARMVDKGHTTITVTTQVKPLGARKWKTLDPVKIVLRVKQIPVPKKQKLDKTYSISMKGSQTFDLNAGRINRKNILSGNTIQANLSRTFTDGEKEFNWESTNEDIVRIEKFTVKPAPDSKGKKSIVTANLKATGIGTAYIVLTGTDKHDKTKVNTAVMKVVVKATAPKVFFVNDVLGLLSDDGKTLTIKEGSCDRLFWEIETENVRYSHNTTEKVSISGSGGVSITNGVLYAKKATKPGKPAKVTIKCGRTKTELLVIVK